MFKYTNSCKMWKLPCASTLMFIITFQLVNITTCTAMPKKQNVSEPVLEFVIVVNRHGSRSPVITYPNDPYKNYWVDRKGELTKQGKQEMHQLGRNLKEHYNILFQGKLNPKRIYVRSTKVDRTMNSAALLLAGMFPPTGEEIWNPDINWQPIPVWPDVYDKSKIIKNKDCPKFRKEQQILLSEAENYLVENKNFTDYIIKHSGINITKITDLVKIYDPLTCQAGHNLLLPKWTAPIYPEKLTEAIIYMTHAEVFGTREMSRLLSGPLLKDFNSWLNRKAAGIVKKKMLIHSGHDLTMLGLFNALNFTDHLKPIKPAASILIELYRSCDGHIVKMLYAKNNSVQNAVQLNLPGCDNPCSLENFFKVTKQMEASDDWHADCQL